MEFIGKEGRLFIFRVKAVFAAGYNVYEAIGEDADGNLKLRKANRLTTWFKSESAARQWAIENQGPSAVS